jgi:chemotaxis protein CheD
MIKSELTITKFLIPGDLCISTEPAVYKTVLGSCIAICLFDRIRRAGGMNHFIYADSKGKYFNDSYGDISCENLIRKMINSGSRKEDLTARIYGGSSSQNGTQVFSPGIKNIEVAKTILQKWNIPILTEDLGGCYGRTITFQTESDQVTVRKLPSCLRNCSHDKKCANSY